MQYLETGSEEIDLKEEVKCEPVSNVHVCARDRGLNCVCGIMEGGEKGLFVDAGQNNLTVVTNKPCLSLNRFSSGIG